MALPAEVLPKLLAFTPNDLLCLSSLRAVNRDAKEQLEDRWWKEEVRICQSICTTGPYHMNSFMTLMLV